MQGVVAWRHAEAQHRVVARLLAFAAQTATGQPEHGIEPVDGAQAFRRHLHQPIVPLDVRDLVAEHGVNPCLAPLVCVRRQQDVWTNQAPGRQHVGSVGLQQRDRPAKAGDCCQDPSAPAPRTIRHRRGAQDDLSQPSEGQREHHGADNDADRPHGDHERGQRRRLRGLHRVDNRSRRGDRGSSEDTGRLRGYCGGNLDGPCGQGP